MKIRFRWALGIFVFVSMGAFAWQAADTEQTRVRHDSGLSSKAQKLRNTRKAVQAQSANQPPMVKQFEETSYYLKAVTFADQKTGWAVGGPHWEQSDGQYHGTIVKTTDGGVTWAPQEPGGAFSNCFFQVSPPSCVLKITCPHKLGANVRLPATHPFSCSVITGSTASGSWIS